MTTSENAKKQVMYSTGEDFYLWCYSILIILDVLGCTSESWFRDHRKLSFLINIINSDKVVYILKNVRDGRINALDKEYLLDSYSDGMMRRSEVLKLLFTLERKGYVTLARGKFDAINVTLNKNSIPAGFLDKETFDSEYKNMKAMKRVVGRLGILTLGSMLEKIYTDNGVKLWAA